MSLEFEEWVQELSRIAEKERPIPTQESEIFILEGKFLCQSFADTFKLSAVCGKLIKALKKDIRNTPEGYICVSASEQVLVNIIYCAAVVLDNCLQKLAIVDKSLPNETLVELTNELLGILWELKSLCEIRPMHIDAMSIMPNNHTLSEGYVVFFRSCANLFQLQIDRSISLCQHSLTRLCELCELVFEAHKYEHMQFLTQFYALDVLIACAEHENQSISTEISRLLGHLVASQMVPSCTKVRACEVLLNRRLVLDKNLSDSTLHSQASQFLSNDLLPDGVIEFLDEVYSLIRHTNRKEIPQILHGEYSRRMSSLLQDSDHVFHVHVSWWNICDEKHEKEIGAFTHRYLLIYSAERVVEIPYGIIQSIRVTSGMLSLKLLTSPRVHHRPHQCLGAQKNNTPHLLYSSISPGEKLSLCLENDGIQRVKKSKFKAWVQSEHSWREKLKSEYKKGHGLSFECYGDIPTRFTGAETEINARDSFRSDRIDPDNLIASFTLDSLNVTATIPTMELTPPILNSVDESHVESPTCFDIENTQATADLRKKPIFCNERSENEINASVHKVMDLSIGKSESRNKTKNNDSLAYIRCPDLTALSQQPGGDQKIQRLLEEVHSAFEEQTSATRAEGHRIVQSTFDYFSKKLKDSKRKLEAGRLSLIENYERDEEKIKQRSSSLRSTMAMTISNMNTEISTIEKSSRSVEESLLKARNHFRETMNILQTNEEQKFRDLEENVGRKMKEFQAKVDDFCDANDPLKLMVNFMAQKRRKM